MSGGSRIFAIGGEAEQAATEEPATAAAEAPAEQAAEPVLDWDDEPSDTPAASWLGPVLVALVLIGWTAFYGWANLWALDGITPQQGITLLVNWSVPVLLLGLVCQMFLRNGRRAARRFGDTARLLADESARLEERLTVVNRELSLAREFLAAQSRDLDSLGRVATEKLSSHADRLQELVRDNGAQVDAIALVSTTALDNMEKLRGQLPVIASSAKDVANNIGNAGRQAQTQIDDMIAGFERLNEFGQSSEAHVEAMGDKARDTVESLTAMIDALEARAGERFAELQTRSEEFRSRLDTDEIAVLASIRIRAAELMSEIETTRGKLDTQESESLTALRARLSALRDESTALGRALRDGEASAIEAFTRSRERLDETLRETLAKLDALDAKAMEAAQARVNALSDEASRFDERLAERNRLFAEETERRRLEAETRHGEAMERIGEHLGVLDTTLAERHAAQEERLRELAALGGSLTKQVDEAAAKVARLLDQTGSAEGAIGMSLEKLTGHLSDGREALREVGSSVSTLTDESVRLLELLQASADHGKDKLPAALSEGRSQLEDLERRVAELGEAVLAASQRSEALAGSIGTTRAAITQSLGEIGALQAGLEQGAGRHGKVLADLTATLEKLDGDSTRLARFAREEMAGTFENLTEATRQAIATLEATSAGTVKGLAEKLAGEGAAALEAVMRARTEQAVAAIDEASHRAADSGRETARTLRDQLAKIDELAGNLERRVAQAREKAEDQVDNDFSRRVALITESLNSNAIDIAKAMSSEVTDSAWAAYLRGDRGVFTRRAVRLLDSQDARSVAQIYGEDGEFREHVSRYIHDFEAMLRQLLSTRDGHALSVTLLSSDMGKLYVALAQSIERLRT